MAKFIPEILSKDENPPIVNIIAFVLFVMVFGCIYSIWTNFIPNNHWILISKILGFLCAISFAFFAMLFDEPKLKSKKVALFVIVLISCYFVLLNNFLYAIPSIVTEISQNKFENEFLVVEKFERQLPLFKDPNCPNRIYVKFEQQDKRKFKICLSHDKLTNINTNEYVALSGKESWFGRKIKDITINRNTKKSAEPGA